MNVFNFTGNIGKDCETRYTPNGKAIADFLVAVKSGYGDHEKTTWVTCKLFGKRAEGKLPAALTKGTKVAISGELTNRQYDKQDGSKGYSLEVAVNALDFISKGDSGSQNPNYDPQGSDQSKSYQDQSGGFEDDDIPFMNPYKYMCYLV